MEGQAAREGTEEAGGAKGAGITTSREAALRVAEKKRSGFTPPGVHENPEEANGKQWGRETQGQRGAAPERETGGPDRGGRQEPKAAVRAGSGEVRAARCGGKSVGGEHGVSWRTRWGNEGPRGTRRGVACQGFFDRGRKP